MVEKRRITVLYDRAEDEEKAKAEAEGKPFPLVYEQVTDALTKRGHEVQAVPVNRNIRALVGLVEKDESDVLFNLCEAIAHLPQHEHNVAGLLELFQKRFTGAGSAGWLLAQDKALSKKIYQFHGIRYPRFSTVHAGKVEWADDLDFPLIVKPLNEDASIGINKDSVVHNVKELLERISWIHESFPGPALVEEYIDGREIYVGVLGNDKPEAFPILEWDLSKVKEGPKIAGSEAKWDPDSEGYKAPEIFPEDIPEAVVKRIQQTAILACQSLRARDYCRVDMRLRERPARERKKSEAPRGGKNATDDGTGEDGWEWFVIEVNPNPWLEKRSEFAMAARKHGLSYPDVLERILELAEQRGRA